MWNQKQSTIGLYGASKGNECVAALEELLKSAGLSQIGVTSGRPDGTLVVQYFAEDLVTSGYTSFTNENEAVPGDFVELTDAYGGTHFGVYLGNGQMVSNSSTPSTFSWYGSVSYEGTTAAEEDDGLPATQPIFFHHSP